MVLLVVGMTVVVFMMVLVAVFFFFISYVYRCSVSCCTDNRQQNTNSPLKNGLYHLHQCCTLPDLLFAYTVSEDLVRDNEVLQLFLEFGQSTCMSFLFNPQRVVRPISQMLRTHLAIMCFPVLPL